MNRLATTRPRTIRAERDDLKRRLTVLVDAAATLDAVTDDVLTILERGYTLNARGVREYRERYHGARVKIAEALGVEVGVLRGGKR
jgi:hypothetical protein